MLALSRRPGRSSLLLLGLVLCAFPATALPGEPTFEVWKTDNSRIKGRIHRLSADGLVLATEQSGEVEVELKGLFKLVRQVDPTEAPPTTEGGKILLPDGDRLHRVTVGAAGEAAIDLKVGSLGNLAFPLDSLLGILLNPPESEAVASAAVAKIRNEPRNSEVLWLANGDRVAGGYLGLDDKKVEFQGPAGKLAIERAGIVSIGFDPALVRYPKPEAPYLEVAFLDGSRLGVTGFRLEKDAILGKSRAGFDLKIGLDDVQGIQVRGASVVLLSDREPAQAQYVGYIGPVRPFKRDACVTGTPLRLAGATYDHGIGTQSRTLLAYRLEPGLKRFQAEVGLDESAGSYGQVVVRVLVDGKLKYTSPPLTSKTATQKLDIPIEGARLLILDTEFGERGDVQDLADWVEARLIR